MRNLLATLLIVFAFAFTLFTAGTASARYALEIDRLTVGVETAEVAVLDQSTDMFTTVTLNLKLDAKLFQDVPVLGTVGIDSAVSYGVVDLTELDEFTGKRSVWDVGFYISPIDALRISAHYGEDIEGTIHTRYMAEAGIFY